MIRFRLAEMMEKKQFAEGRRITVNEVATATGLNRMTLSKLLNHKGYGTGTETIDKLCNYFGCGVDDLMEHLPTDASSAAASKDKNKTVGSSLNGSAR